MKEIPSQVDVLIGLQYGDEGKGRMVQQLTQDRKYDVGVRYQGGPNAGHTVYYQGQKLVLHHLPVSIINGVPEIFLAAGMVINPIKLLEEIKTLQDLGFELPKLYWAREAHLITLANIEQDKYLESTKTKKIGTTLRGIGPTYAQKISRTSLRLEILNQANWEQLLEDENQAQYEEWVASLTTLNSMFELVSTSQHMRSVILANKSVLAEGAQGWYLDIDHGCYPYVTSSNTGLGGAINYLALPPQAIRNVYGIFKPYETRVGSGDMSLERNDQWAQQIADLGHEKGATTGRPRRIGVLDLDLLAQAVFHNGVTHPCMMKIDILETIQNQGELSGLQLKSGNEIKTCASVIEFVQTIERALGLDIHYISEGPELNQGYYNLPF